MRTRIARRKNNLQDQNRVPCTRIIKIGKKAKSPRGVEYPEPLNGFVIYNSLLDNDNKSIVDYEAMAMLGVDKGTVDTAIAAGRKSIGLPTELRFRIQANAVRSDGGWEFPTLFQEEYSCFDNDGRFCHGNGNRAKRRQPDRSIKEIICNPVGCSDVDPSEYCPYSINSQEKDKKQKICNYRYQVFLSLFIIDSATGEPTPLNHNRDWGLRYGLGSGSETCGMEISDELEAAANQLDGDIHHITGTLHFGKRGKHYVDPKTKKKATSYVPQIYMVLSPVDIHHQIEKHRQMLLEDRSFQAALPAPTAHEEEAAAPQEESEIVDAEIEEEPEESPFGAPPTTTPEEAVEPPVSALDGVSDEDLADSLMTFAGDQLAAYAMYTHKGEEHRIDDISWFFEGAQGAKDQARRQLLRGICRGLLDTPGTAFEIIVHREATE